MPTASSPTEACQLQTSLGNAVTTDSVNADRSMSLRVITLNLDQIGVYCMLKCMYEPEESRYLLSISQERLELYGLWKNINQGHLR